MSVPLFNHLTCDGRIDGKPCPTPPLICMSSRSWVGQKVDLADLRLVAASQGWTYHEWPRGSREYTHASVHDYCPICTANPDRRTLL